MQKGNKLPDLLYLTGYTMVLQLASKSRRLVCVVLRLEVDKRSFLNK